MSITLTTPLVIPQVSGASVGTQTVPNFACLTVQDNGLSGVSSVVGYFGTVTQSGGIDSAFAVALGLPSITITLNQNTGANEIVCEGVVLLNTILTGTALANALATFTAGELAVRDAADYDLLQLGILAGAQNDKWASGDL
jgi:hypothetical protein